MDYNIFSQFTFVFDVSTKLSLPPCFFVAKFFTLNNIFRMLLSSFAAFFCLCLPACLNAKPMLVENPFMTIAIDRWDNVEGGLLNLPNFSCPVLKGKMSCKNDL